MPAPTLSEINAIPDVLMQHQYRVRFGTIPGYGSADNLPLLCFNGNIPGRSNEMVDLSFPGGHIKKERGRNIFPKILSLSFYEIVNAECHRALQNWFEFMGGRESGNSGGYSNEYGIPVEIDVFDTVGNVSLVYAFNKFTVLEIPDTPLNSEASASMQVNAQFSYNTYDPLGVPAR